MGEVLLFFEAKVPTIQNLSRSCLKPMVKSMGAGAPPIEAVPVHFQVPVTCLKKSATSTGGLGASILAGLAGSTGLASGGLAGSILGAPVAGAAVGLAASGLAEGVPG